MKTLNHNKMALKISRLPAGKAGKEKLSGTKFLVNALFEARRRRGEFAFATPTAQFFSERFTALSALPRRQAGDRQA